MEAKTENLAWIFGGTMIWVSRRKGGIGVSEVYAWHGSHAQRGPTSSAGGLEDEKEEMDE